jgi:hypothetical protein
VSLHAQSPTTIPAELNSPQLADTDGKMADTAVLMECSKSVITQYMHTFTHLTEPRLTYSQCSFLDTFEVLVGTAPEQKLFTVHRDIATKRSGFFRAAKSGRWTQTKPTDLHEHDPDTFNRYLHCLYRNALPDILLPIISDEEQETYSFEEFVANEKHRTDCKFGYLIDLYVLADSLIDPFTANMAITEIRRFGLKDSCSPGAKVVDRVFRSTREGDGLRNLLADCYIYNPYVQFDSDFPKAFLLLVLQRFQHEKIKETVTFDEETIEELQSDSLYTIGQHFQKLEQSPE